MKINIHENPINTIRNYLKIKKITYLFTENTNLNGRISKLEVEIVKRGKWRSNLREKSKRE